MKIKLTDLFSHYYANQGISLQLANFSFRLKQGKFSSDLMMALRFGILVSNIRNIKSPRKFIDTEKDLPFYSKMSDTLKKEIDELESLFESLYGYTGDELTKKFETAIIEKKYISIENYLNQINILNSCFMNKMKELKNFEVV